MLNQSKSQGSKKFLDSGLWCCPAKKVLGRSWLISEHKMLKNSKQLICIQKATEQERLICIPQMVTSWLNIVHWPAIILSPGFTFS